MKKCVIMRGLPGSGKSTLALNIYNKAICSELRAIICATDDFFMINGEYKFSMDKLSINHRYNQLKAEYSIQDGVDYVIIDNVNANVNEILFYAQVAIDHDYCVEFIEPSTTWMYNKDGSWDIETLLNKNAHGVPRESYERMLASWEETDDIGDALANHLNCTYDCVTQTLFKELE